MNGVDVKLGVSAGTHASVLCAGAQPLGVPLIFVQEWLASSAPGLSIMARQRCVDLLVRQYAQARGYSFDWGQLLEQRLGDVTVWRVVPVAVWADRREQAVAIKADGAQHVPIRGGIVALTGALHALVREHVPLRPHPDVMRCGCSGGGQRAPYALLSLLCAPPNRVPEVREWLASQFLGQTLPDLLSACRTWLDDADSAEAARACVHTAGSPGHGTGDQRATVLTESLSGGGMDRSRRSA